MHNPIHRRHALKGLAGLTASTLPAIWHPSWASETAFPQRAVRIVVNSNPGVSTDIIARAVAQHLQDKWGQPVLVENRPGASGTIGAAEVVRSKPDGHTLLIGVTGLLQTEFLMPKLSYRFSTDLVPVTMLAKGANAIVVGANSPYTSLKQWVDVVKREPGKHSYGSYGNGTTAHIWGETFKRKAQIELLHVPFKGSGPMIQDVVAGQIEAAFPDLAGAMAMIKGGKLRVLALTGTERHPAVPDAPTFKELGYSGLEPYGWYGILAPKGTPTALVTQLSQAWIEAIQTPKIKAAMDGMGLVTVAATPEQFRRILLDDTPVWERAIREGNIQLDG